MGSNIKITAFFKAGGRKQPTKAGSFSNGPTKKALYTPCGLDVSPITDVPDAPINLDAFPKKNFDDPFAFDDSPYKKDFETPLDFGGSLSKKPFNNPSDLDNSLNKKDFNDPYGLNGYLPKNTSDSPILFDDPPFDYDAFPPYKPSETTSTSDGSLAKKDFEFPFIAPRSPPKKLFPALATFNMASFKAERARAIARTEEAIIEVVQDLCGYVDRNKDSVHTGQTQLVEVHGAEVLATRYIEGCPVPLKATLGQEGGIDYFALADLHDDPECKPDSHHCGSYFFGGVPKHTQLQPRSLPIHCGETANASGMRQRTSDHMNESFRTKTKWPLPVYSAIDDPRYPLKPFVLATCKEKIRDKYFDRFAEAITRQLLGTNMRIPALAALNSLPSYGILKFIQPVEPYNKSMVLREGNRSDVQSEVLSDRQTVAAENRRERHTENERARSQRMREAYVCAVCMSTESPTWLRDRDADEDLGDRVCGRCDSYHVRQGSYPSPEVLRSLDEKAALAKKRANEAASAPSTATKKKRGPLAGREARIPNSACANSGCNTTETHKWYYDTSLKAYVCAACYRFRKDHSRYPDYVSGKDRKRAKKKSRAEKQLDFDGPAQGSPSDGPPPSSHT
ncbi:hypothetical protein M436DRAFT_60588 [Aureobasidium namibiae CBS 147.97]|uniref:GATA-type domain-containing protein n=1 Tax=Aureobasidium namibiae CBS 147.97 TaxID=1043004 RepID=A0A074WUD1_9PEZI